MMNGNSESARVVVIDGGSSAVRVGVAGDEAPRRTFPSVVGRVQQSAKRRVGSCFQRTKNSYIGDEVQKRADIMAMSYPIERGIVTNWNDMQKLWSYALKQIGADPESSPVLLSQPYLRRKANRKMIVQLWFEEFRTPALHVAISGALSLYATRRTTGLVLECGDGCTQAIPVFESQPIREAVHRFELAGRDLTDHLIRMLYQREYYFDPLYHRQTVNQIKEKMCSVALDFTQDIKDIASTSKFLEKAYKLPDGEVIKLGAERFLCAETMFEPLQMGLDIDGVQQTVYEAIMQCDGDIRKQLLTSIVLSGGSTLFSGFAERLRQEVVSLLPANTPVSVLAVPERQNLNWIGGSVLGSLSTFSARCITKREYDEVGTSIIYRKDL